MCLQRVRRHPRIVAPDLAQEGIAADYPVAGAIEVFEDRGLFFGQPYFFRPLGSVSNFALGRKE